MKNLNNAKRRMFGRWIALALSVALLFQSTGLRAYANDLPEETLLEADETLPSVEEDADGGTSGDELPTDDQPFDASDETEGDDLPTDPQNETGGGIGDEPNDDGIEKIEEEAPEDTETPEDAPDEEDEEPLLPDGVVGMPDDYELTEQEIDLKEDIVSHDVVGTLETLTEGVDYVRNEVICFADSYEHAELIAQAYGGKLLDFGYGVATIWLNPAEISVQDAVEIGADLGVEIPAVEPNYIIPYDDPVVGTTSPSNGISQYSANAPQRQTWETAFVDRGFDDPGLNPYNEQYQWMHAMIDTYGAWGVTMGDPSIVVAVVDSGVDEHEDIKSRLTRVDMGQGKDDNYGHGTHVAGIIAAEAGNDYCGAGVAPNVSLLSLSLGTDVDTAAELKALQYVAGYGGAERKADIVNLSLGNIEPYSGMLETMFDTLYDADVTVVAAMGNSSANFIQYPAAYDHVIAVCAVDETGAKTSFSNFGAWADIAAPGINIWSTLPTVLQYEPEAIDGMYPMMGTSQAAPVVAGACALYMSAYGHVGPDQMERVLKSSVTKSSSSQIGAGIVNVAKMFSADTTPPKIEVKTETRYGVAENGKTTTVALNVPQTASVVISADGFKAGEGDDAGVLIYTTDGKAPVVKNGEIVTGEIYTGAAIPVSSLIDGAATTLQKVTIKAAYVSGMGVVTKPTTLIFTVAPSISGAVEITGNDYIAAGTSATFKAMVSPATIKNKTVTWTVEAVNASDASYIKQGTKTESGKVVYNAKSGAVMIAADLGAALAEHQFKIVATSAETGVANGEKIFTVMPRADKVTIELKDAASRTDMTYYKPVYKNGVLTSVQIYTSDINPDAPDVTAIALSAELKAAGLSIAATPRWTSSNVKAATVDANGVVTAVAKGTTTITCAAADGGNKKATVKINVVQPVEQIAVTGQKYIASGATATYKAIVTGNANNQKVGWRMEGVDATAQGLIDQNAVTINPTTGKVTVAKGIAVAGQKFKIIATAKDEGGAESAPFEIELADKATSVVITTAETAEVYQIIKKDAAGTLVSARLFTENIGTYSVNETQIALQATVSNGTTPVWTSSNQKVATVDENGVVTAVAKGTATITCAAQDGSGKKASAKITVAVPVRSIAIAGQAYIPKGASATYKTTSALPATASNKQVVWNLTAVNAADQSYVSVGTKANAGKATINPSSGRVTIGTAIPASLVGKSFRVTATAKDGSGIVSDPVEFTITQNKITSITISPSSSADNYMATRNKKGILTSAQLYTVDINGTAVNEKELQLSAILKAGSVTTGDIPVWKSSNEKAVVIDGDPVSDTITIRAVGKGSAKITCTAQDGGKASASLTVNVIIPVSSFSLVGKNGQDNFIAVGKKASITPVFDTAYGAPTNQKLSWMYLVIVNKYNDYGEQIATDIDVTMSVAAWSKKLFSVSNGTIQAPSQSKINDFYNYLYKNNYDTVHNRLAGVMVYAMTTDGTDKEVYRGYKLSYPTTSINVGSQWEWVVYDTALYKNKEMYTIGGKTMAWDNETRKYIEVRWDNSKWRWMKQTTGTTEWTTPFNDAEELWYWNRKSSVLDVSLSGAKMAISATGMHYEGMKAFAEAKNTVQFCVFSDGAIDYSVTSSNPDIASAYMAGQYLTITPNMKGKVTITLAARDGSGAKKKITVNVTD